MHGVRSPHFSEVKPEKLSVNTNTNGIGGGGGGYVMYLPCYVSSPTKLSSDGSQNWPSILPLSPTMHMGHMFALPMSPRSLKATDSPLPQALDFPMLSPTSASSGMTTDPFNDYRPPRPPNSFILFRKEQQAILRKQFPKMANGEISKEIARMWKSLSQGSRDVYIERASQIRAEYTRKYPSHASIISTNSTVFRTHPSSMPMSPPLSPLEFFPCGPIAATSGNLGSHQLEDFTGGTPPNEFYSRSPRHHRTKNRRHKSATTLLDRFHDVSSHQVSLSKRRSNPIHSTTIPVITHTEKILPSYTTTTTTTTNTFLEDDFDEFDDETDDLSRSHPFQSMNELSHGYIEESTPFHSLPLSNSRMLEPPSLDNLHNHHYESDVPAETTMSFSGEFDSSNFLSTTNSMGSSSIRTKEDMHFMMEMLSDDTTPKESHHQRQLPLPPSSN